MPPARPTSFDYSLTMDSKPQARMGDGARGTRDEVGHGLLAEQHVASYWGLPWWGENHSPDLADLWVGDFSVDVKWTGTNTLIVKDYKPRLDLYVAVTGEGPYHIEGIYPGRAVGSKPTHHRLDDTRTPGQGLFSWRVPFNELFRVELIFDILQRIDPERFIRYIEQEYPQSAWDPEAGAQVATSNPTQHLPTLHPHRG